MQPSCMELSRSLLNSIYAGPIPYGTLKYASILLKLQDLESCLYV